MKLKADLHTHTAEDPVDFVNYSVYRLIERAAELQFDVLSITNHDEVLYSKKIVEFAEKRNILLIPGMELTLSGKHVLVLNPGFSQNPVGRSLDDLKAIKRDNNLIVAPHPFFPQAKALKFDFYRYLPYFDAVEFSHFYNRWINCNKKAIQAAREHSLPLLGTSDCHYFYEFGTTYSMIEAEKDPDAVIKAVKDGRIEIISRPLPSWRMGRTAIFSLLIKLRKDILRISL